MCQHLLLEPSFVQFSELKPKQLCTWVPPTKYRFLLSLFPLAYRVGVGVGVGEVIPQG